MPGATTVGEDLVDWYLDARRPEAVSELRREIVGYLERHGDPGEAQDDAALVVAELLGNVARHTTGPGWVTLTWTGERPVLVVADLGPGFELEAVDPEALLLEESGRGLIMVGELANDLAVAARVNGGAIVTATLPVSRPAEADRDPPRRNVSALPLPEEARPEGGFGKESFLRALVVQIAATIEAQQGPAAAEEAVAQVAADVGGRMEDEFRLSRDIVGRLGPEQLAECFVRLKHAIEGGFYVIEVTPERIVLGNDRCPFGDVVQRAPSLCRMTSAVFGGIAARNTDGSATVLLEERISLGDPGCRVVVDLVPADDSPPAAHRYLSPSS